MGNVVAGDDYKDESGGGGKIPFRDCKKRAGRLREKERTTGKILREESHPYIRGDREGQGKSAKKGVPLKATGSSQKQTSL